MKKKWNQKLMMLNYEIHDILKHLQFELKDGTLKNRYFKRKNGDEYEVKFKISNKRRNKWNEVAMNNEDTLLFIDTKIYKY